MNKRFSVHFVCLGNICRSPLAEYCFRNAIDEAGLNNSFSVSSSGTGSWHVGQGADSRMRKTSAGYGVDMKDHRAQQFDPVMFGDADLILAMDKSNLHDILSLDDDGEFASIVRLFREFDPEPGDYQVPDPYYGGAQGFEEVFAIVDRTARSLLTSLRSHLSYDSTEA